MTPVFYFLFELHVMFGLHWADTNET